MEDVLVQTVPEFVDREFARLLVAVIAIAAALYIGRIVLSIAWRIVTIAVFVVVVLFAASSLGIV